MHGIALASGKGGGSESAERSETDATKEHPKGEREGWRERVSRAERDRCDEGAPEGRAGRVARASQPSGARQMRRRSTRRASGKGGGSESAERSETDATKEHPKGEREGWRERVSRAERDRCDEGAPEGRAGRVARASQPSGARQMRRRSTRRASGKGGGSESAERSETDATKEHPKGEREGWRERVNSRSAASSMDPLADHFRSRCSLGRRAALHPSHQSDLTTSPSADQTNADANAIQNLER